MRERLDHRISDELSRRQLLRAALVVGGGMGVASVLGGCGSDDPAPDANTGYLVSDAPRVPGSEAAGLEVAAAMSALGVGLHRRAVTANGNLVCSPWSAAVALAMTRTGARGGTAREMDHALGVAPSTLGPGITWLERHLAGLAGERENSTGRKGPVGLESADSVWGQRGERWQQPFLDALARDYGAGLRVADYATDAEGARRAINTWVSGQTHDRITDLIPRETLDALTRLVLVNALYLRAPWYQHFDKSETRTAAFVRPDGSRVSSPMMNAMLEAGGYAEGDGWQAARLPYAGKELAMTIVVPRGGVAIGELEEQMGDGGLARVLAAVRPGPVQVALPRWTFRSAIDLKPVLSALGMSTAFTDAADFSGMTTQERLLIKAVVQQVFIAVDEEGTEAAAATAVVMEATSGAVGLATVRADRAFLFVVHDVQAGAPLFFGRVADPTAK